MIIMTILVVTGLCVAAAVSWIIAFLVIYGKILLMAAGICLAVLYGGSFAGLYVLGRVLQNKDVLTSEHVASAEGGMRYVLQTARASLILLTGFCAIMAIAGIAAILAAVFIL